MSLDDAALGRYLDVTYWQLEHKSRSVVEVNLEYNAMVTRLRRLTECKQMIGGTVAWRKEMKMPNMDVSRLLEAARTRQGDPFCSVKQVHFNPSPSCTAIEVYVNGFDREGRAILIYTPTTDRCLPCKHVATDESTTYTCAPFSLYFSACPVETSVHYLVYNLERALALGAAGLSPTKQKVQQYTFIVDLSATGAVSLLLRVFCDCTDLRIVIWMWIGQIPPLNTVKASFVAIGKHYPMRPGKILLVNGGGMIQWIWRVLEPLVDPRTRDKVSIVSAKDEAAVMGALIAPDQLEARFAGGLNGFKFDPEAYVLGSGSKRS
jgi:hypothetical protein